MLFILSFTLSVLTLAAGVFLLMKSKQGLGKFFSIMSWIIFAFGIFAIVGSVHLAVMKHLMMHRDGESFMNRRAMFYDDDMDKDMKFEKCEKMCDSKKSCDMDMEKTVVKKIDTIVKKK